MGARTPDSIALFKDDIEYQVKAGFCKVFLWDDLQKLRPANLKISPGGRRSSSTYHSRCIRTKMASSQSLKRA